MHSMAQKPFVTVITPAYNAEQTLSQTVSSILAQTWQNWEYILIDDGSTDKTWQILKKLQKKDSRIRIYKNEKNLGIAGTRNRGLGLAGGKYIAWQDADDISLPERLQLQVQRLESNPKIGIVGGWLEFFDNTGKVSVRQYAEEDALLRKRIFRYSPVAQPVAMIRRECFDTVGFYNVRFPPAEDIEMSFRIGTYYQFSNIPQILLRYRMAESSATYRQLRKIERFTFEARLKNVLNAAYSFNFIDLIYNCLQFGVVVWLPAKVKISLFNLLRNT